MLLNYMVDQKNVFYKNSHVLTAALATGQEYLDILLAFHKGTLNPVALGVIAY